jgi:hypothetical protein
MSDSVQPVHATTPLSWLREVGVRVVLAQVGTTRSGEWRGPAANVPIMCAGSFGVSCCDVTVSSQLFIKRSRLLRPTTVVTLVHGFVDVPPSREAWKLLPPQAHSRVAASIYFEVHTGTTRYHAKYISRAWWTVYDASLSRGRIM